MPHGSTYWLVSQQPHWTCIERVETVHQPLTAPHPVLWHTMSAAFQESCCGPGHWPRSSRQQMQSSYQPNSPRAALDCLCAWP